MGLLGLAWFLHFLLLVLCRKYWRPRSGWGWRRMEPPNDADKCHLSPTTHSTGWPYHQDYYSAETPRFRRKPSYCSIKHYFVNRGQWSLKSSLSTMFLRVSGIQLDPREPSGPRLLKAGAKPQCRTLLWGYGMLTFRVLDPHMSFQCTDCRVSKCPVLCAQKLWSLPMDSQDVRPPLPTFVYCAVSWVPVLNWTNRFFLLKTQGCCSLGQWFLLITFIYVFMPVWVCVYQVFTRVQELELQAVVGAGNSIYVLCKSSMHF